MKNNQISKLYTLERKEKTITTKEYKSKYVNLETTMKACKECPMYQNNWGCPDFPEETYQYWQKYDNIQLILTKINFTQEAQNNTYNLDELTNITDNTLFAEKMKLINYLEEQEKQKHGVYLSAGYCNYCKECEKQKQKPCKYPEKCRCSIESIGGLVGETINGVFNEEIKWIDTKKGKLPENLSLLMAVLY